MESFDQGSTDTAFTALSLGDVVMKVQDLEMKSQKSEARALEMEEKLKESHDLMQEMKRRLSASENKVASIAGFTGPNQWFRVGTNAPVESSQLPKDYEEEQFTLPKDVYSVVASSHWKSFPFLISLFIIFGFQIFLLVLLLEDQVNWGGDNVLGIPANVETSVRTAQILALIIALFDQDDIRIGIEGLSDGAPSIYNGDGRFKRVNVLQWVMAYTLRFAQGFLGLFCSFLLLVQAETVFDVLLNFLGVKFVSELDDLAFILGGQGYFGSGLKQFVKAVDGATFLREQPNTTTPLAGVKKYANVVGVFAVLIAMGAVFTNLAVRQDEGSFSIPHISVEFGDEVLSYLGLFNGYYEAHESGGEFHRRLVYEQVGVGSDRSGKLGYCLDLGDEEASAGWVLFVDSDGPCRNYMARSEATKTFDVLEAGAMQWYTNEGLPLDYLEVTRVFSSPQNYWSGTYTERNRPCEEVDLSGSFTDLTGARSTMFDKLPVEIVHQNRIFDSTLAHPIYLGRSSWEVVLFTGRRWILVDGKKVSNLSVHRNSSSWDMTGAREFFYNKREFQTTDQPSGWVLLVSEVVEAATNPGTPFGLQWFHPRYGDSRYNFPFADLTRPQVAKMACARCDEQLYPCAHGGTCSEGFCTCANRATGSLCQKVPTGDGVCDRYFNNEAYGWDDGDCCGSTCDGALCGVNGLSLAFGADPTMFREFRRDFESTIAKGFEICKDPDMLTFTIELFRGSDPIPDSLERCKQESYEIICDDKLHVQAPSTFPLCSSNHERVQTVHLPNGAKCAISRLNGALGSLYDIAIYYGDDINSEPVRVVSNYTEQVILSIPNKCVMDVLLSRLDTIPMDYTAQGSAVTALSQDDVATFLCSLDEGLLLERYAFAVMYQTGFLLDANFDEHQCNGFISQFDGSTITCSEEDSVVEYIKGSNFRDSTIPPEIAFLSNLENLVFPSHGIIGSLPTEIGLLTKLTNLDAGNNLLEGQIPSELGLLTNLVTLNLSSNNFTGSIPTELNSLQNLNNCSIANNNITWMDQSTVCR